MKIESNSKIVSTSISIVILQKYNNWPHTIIDRDKQRWYVSLSII